MLGWALGRPFPCVPGQSYRGLGAEVRDWAVVLGLHRVASSFLGDCFGNFVVDLFPVLLFLFALLHASLGYVGLLYSFVGGVRDLFDFLPSLSRFHKIARYFANIPLAVGICPWGEPLRSGACADVSGELAVPPECLGLCFS